MNALITKGLQNIRVREVICYCDVHAGELLKQLDAQLPNGKPIAILEDGNGLHVAIGERNAIGKFPYTPAITEAEAARMIAAAMK